MQAQLAEAILQLVRLAEAGRLNEQQKEQVLRAMDYMAGALIVEHQALAATPNPCEAITLGLLQELVPASQQFPADSDLAFLAISIANHFQLLYPQRLAVVTPHLETLASAWPQNLSCLQALADHYLRLAQQQTGQTARNYARQAQAFAQQVVARYPSHLPFREHLIAAARITGDSDTITQQQAAIEHLTPLVHPDNRLRPK
jgi:hypothetical protein